MKRPFTPMTETIPRVRHAVITLRMACGRSLSNRAARLPRPDAGIVAWSCVVTISRLGTTESLPRPPVVYTAGRNTARTHPSSLFLNIR